MLFKGAVEGNEGGIDLTKSVDSVARGYEGMRIQTKYDTSYVCFTLLVKGNVFFASMTFDTASALHDFVGRLSLGPEMKAIGN